LIKLYSGSSNFSLAKKIAKELNVSIGKIELSNFSNTECSVYVSEKRAGDTAIFVQSFSNPTDKHIIEFFLVIDALKRKGVKKIITLIPWLGYSPQDQVYRKGEALSIKVIVDLINPQKLDHILTFDLHNKDITKYFKSNFKEISSFKTIIGYLVNKSLKPDLLVSPDLGSFSNCLLFAKNFKTPLITINKIRNLKTGETSIRSVKGNIKGKKALIIDDFVSTGGTLLQTVDFLKKNGVHEIYAAVVHHFYCKGAQEKIDNSNLDMLYVTDTINMPDKMYKKLDIISIAKLAASEISKLL
jgi:ribose-phosphate pyrophosphokinase